jgi:hypothetical protein
MAVKLTEHPNGLMVDFGDDVRIERTHFHVKKQPVLDDKGQPMKTSTGQPMHTHVPHIQPRLDAEGKHVHEFVRDPNTGLVVRDDKGERVTAPVYDPVVDDKGEPLYMWNVYKRTPNDPHPERPGLFVHGHHGAETTETHTWLHVSEGTEAEARAKARQLVGE